MDNFLDTPLEKIFKWCGTIFRPTVKLGESETIEPFLLCEPKKRIGIEVEVEGLRDIPSNLHREFWDTASDGSLRNGGVEFVSRALAGREIVVAVENLFRVLPKSADFSERTSIHVHVNIREQTVGQLLTVLLLYVTFERLLYQFAGAQRVQNIFCVPVQETRYPYVLSDALIHQSIPELTKKWRKYSGLNLRRMTDLGTLEYRQMEGHRDTQRLLNWINIILRMHRYTRRHSFLRVYEEIKMLNTSSMYEQYTRTVFGTDADILMGSFDVKNMLEVGVTTAKHISIPSPFFHSLLDEMSEAANLLKGLEISLDARNKQPTKIPKMMSLDEWAQVEEGTPLRVNLHTGVHHIPNSFTTVTDINSDELAGLFTSAFARPRS